MTISAGIGIANFPFDDARGFWQWVDLCDRGGIDSIWQSDRLISRDANLECMSATQASTFGMLEDSRRIGFNICRLPA